MDCATAETEAFVLVGSGGAAEGVGMGTIGSGCGGLSTGARGRSGGGAGDCVTAFDRSILIMYVALFVALVTNNQLRVREGADNSFSNLLLKRVSGITIN